MFIRKTGRSIMSEKKHVWNNKNENFPRPCQWHVSLSPQLQIRPLTLKHDSDLWPLTYGPECWKTNGTLLSNSVKFDWTPIKGNNVMFDAQFELMNRLEYQQYDYYCLISEAFYKRSDTSCHIIQCFYETGAKKCYKLSLW